MCRQSSTSEVLELGCNCHGIHLCSSNQTEALVKASRLKSFCRLVNLVGLQFGSDSFTLTQCIEEFNTLSNQTNHYNLQPASSQWLNLIYMGTKSTSLPRTHHSSGGNPETHQFHLDQLDQRQGEPGDVAVGNLREEKGEGMSRQLNRRLLRHVLKV